MTSLVQALLVKSNRNFFLSVFKKQYILDIIVLNKNVLGCAGFSGFLKFSLLALFCLFSLGLQMVPHVGSERSMTAHSYRLTASASHFRELKRKWESQKNVMPLPTSGIYVFILTF